VKRLLAIALFAGSLAGLAACDMSGGDLRVENAVYRAPLGASDVGVAYFTIRSPKADRIVAVSSVGAEAVEMHGTVMEDNMASMQRLETVDLPAGKDVVFAQGGKHLMVFSPKAVAPGKSFPITIQLESGRKDTVEFKTGG
jgi:periplasmic copper chaperone A